MRGISFLWGAGREVFAQDKGNWLILFCFVLNSILKSFSVDLPHKDKLDFYFLCRENNAIYLILHLIGAWNGGSFLPKCIFLTDWHIKG